MSYNVVCVSLPLFIILFKLKNLPDELKELTESHQIYIALTESEFIARDTFRIWSFHFIHFLTEYRLKIKDPKINKNVLLILDRLK